MTDAVRVFLKELGLPEDLLVETAERYVKAMREMTAGYAGRVEEILQPRFSVDSPQSLSRHGGTGIIAVRPIHFSSLCEHHCLPFTGVAKVAYVPSRDELGQRRVVGLSKMIRVVRLYAERFTMQERIGECVAHALMEVAIADGAMVIIRARHSCMCSRGVKDAAAESTTFFCAGSLDVGRPLHVTATKILDPSPRVPL